MGQKDWGILMMISKTVSNQLGMPKEWGGSRATTPGLLNDVDENNME